MQTINDVLENSVNKYSKNIAIMTNLNGYSPKSYKDMKKEIDYFACMLKNNGISQGDKVAILSENRMEWPIAFFAVQKLGAVAVPIDKERNKSEIDYILDHSESKTVIVSDKYLDKLPDPQKRINLDECWKDVSANAPPADSGVNSLSSLKGDDLAVLAYTSGTTGKPKGVMLTHGNITSNIDGVQNHIEIRQNDNFLSILPLYHMFELTAGMLTPISCGAKITYASSFRPDKIVQTMKESGTTVLLCVPALYEKMHSGIKKKLGKLNIENRIVRYFAQKMVKHSLGGKIRLFVSGGAPIQPETVRGFEALGIPLLEGYGLTETTPVLSVNPSGKNMPGSVGIPLYNVKIRIVDVPEMEIFTASSGEGEILVSGPNIMKGYFKDEAATSEVLSKDGWFATGDIGRLDKDGYLYITGRKKDIIVTGGGQNVSASKLEGLLCQSSLIREAIVLGRKTSKGREEICAAIYPADGAKREDILREVAGYNNKLADFERISRANVVLVDSEFEKTSLKKIKKFKYKPLFDKL